MVFCRFWNDYKIPQKMLLTHVENLFFSQTLYICSY